MEKKKLITGIVAGVIGLALVGTIAYLYVNLDSQRKENKAMQELADLDKKEMENEYQQFANQYSEMKTQITNDSIVAQLTAEQEKTERLLKELKDTKSSDAREIARLKKDIEYYEGFLASVMKKLSNERFTSKAPAAVVDAERRKQADAEQKLASLRASLASLSK